MNPTPEPTPFDVPAPATAAPETPAPQAEAAARERAEMEAKMALLPNYSDEAFPRRPSLLSLGTPGASATPAASADEAGASEAGKPMKKRGSGDNAGRGFGPDLSDDAVSSPGSAIMSGCFLGVAANIVLGFVLVGLARAGLAVYGPGALAIVVALVMLTLVLGSWPRRVWVGAGGFLFGLLLSFAVLFLFVRPTLIGDSRSDSGSRDPAALPDAPAPSNGGPPS